MFGCEAGKRSRVCLETKSGRFIVQRASSVVSNVSRCSGDEKTRAGQLKVATVGEVVNVSQSSNADYLEDQDGRTVAVRRDDNRFGGPAGGNLEKGSFGRPHTRRVEDEGC